MTFAEPAVPAPAQVFFQLFSDNFGTERTGARLIAARQRRIYNSHRCQRVRQRTLSESMGCKLVRGETIYFIRHAGRTSGADLESEWFRAETDHRLLPAVYVRSDGHAAPTAYAAAFPVEIRTFEGS